MGSRCPARTRRRSRCRGRGARPRADPRGSPRWTEAERPRRRSSGAITSAPSRSPVHQTATAAAAPALGRAPAIIRAVTPMIALTIAPSGAAMSISARTVPIASRRGRRPAARTSERGGENRLQRVAHGDGGGGRERDRRGRVRQERAQRHAGPGARAQEDEGGERDAGGGPDERDALPDRGVVEAEAGGGVVHRGEHGDPQQPGRGAGERNAGARKDGHPAPHRRERPG